MIFKAPSKPNLSVIQCFNSGSATGTEFRLKATRMLLHPASLEDTVIVQSLSHWVSAPLDKVEIKMNALINFSTCELVLHLGWRQM